MRLLDTIPDAPDFSDANGWTDESHYGSITLTDADRDGLLDVCGRGNLGYYCAPY